MTKSHGKPGKFIAFEGGEGTGKSTQARRLVQALERAGVETVLTREPGGTPRAEAVRELLLNPPNDGWNAKAEALLFAAARSDHVDTLIKPSLDKGTWVICDRFVDSSRAYQGGAGGLGDDAITALHGFGSDGLRADATILLTVDAEVALTRLADRDKGASDAIGGRSADYHRSVGERFRELALDKDNAIISVDGMGDATTVHERLVDALKTAGVWP